jgi:hypothetical protein
MEGRMIAIAKTIDDVPRIQEVYLFVADVVLTCGECKEAKPVEVLLTRVYPGGYTQPMLSADPSKLPEMVKIVDAMVALGAIKGYRIIKLSGRQDVTDQVKLAAQAKVAA